MDRPNQWTDTVDSARWTVLVHGELDLDTAPALREHLANTLGRCDGELVVDLTGVSFCDSSGLGALVATRRRAELLERRLVLRLEDAGRVLRLLELSALGDHFELELVPSHPQALGAAQASKSSVTSSVSGTD